ncbi:MAG: endonuclease/exonuclease/phosphatase family protein, partial [Candidatus Heimdallarchaeota archaeon]
MKLDTKVYSVILIIVLLITIFSILGYQYYGEPDNNDGPVSSIRVMSYNIHLGYDYGARGNINLEKIAELIKENRIDIIGFQESDTNRLASSNQNGMMWLAHKLKMYYYYGAPTSEGIWGVSLLSRWEIEDPAYYKLPSDGALQRIAVVVKINVPQPFSSVDVLVTHLDFKSSEIQLKQIQKIIDIATEKPRAIIMGDFNTVIAQDQEGKTLDQDPSYKLLNDTFDDAWVLSGGSFSELSSYYFDESDIYDISNSRIDYVWLYGTLSVVPNSHLALGS